MRAQLAAYSAGIVLVGFVPAPRYLLPLALLASIVALILIISVALHGSLLPFKKARSSRQRRCVFLLISVLLGITCHGWWASGALAQRESLSRHLANYDVVEVRGRVKGLPVASETGRPGSRFLFKIEVVLEGPAQLLKQTVQLRDYSGVVFRSGEAWTLRLRLRAPRGLANPGGFDSEAWFLQRGIVARGYVREDGAHQLQRQGVNLDAIRGLLQRRIENSIHSLVDLDAHAKSVARAILPALLLGDDGGIGSELRMLFQRTGTTHLFVISGLHIGLIAVATYLVFSYLLRLVPSFSARFVVQRAAILISLFSALVYALISGFDLPAQRALLMLSVFILAGFTARSVNVWLRYWFALAAVLTLNPLAVVNAGFWFSFVAVAVLILVSESSAGKWSLRGCLVPQLSIFVGLLVPLTFWIGQVSLIAPFINILAIPFLGLFVVPLAFVALIFLFVWEAAGQFLIALITKSLVYFLDGLGALSNGSLIPTRFIELSLSPPGAIEIVFATAAVLLLILPISLVWRSLAIPLLLAFIFNSAAARELALTKDELVVRVFDVGQGLAVLLSIDGRNLLYDAGPAWDSWPHSEASDDESVSEEEQKNSSQQVSSGWSAATAVILPALNRLGVTQLDVILISHWDNDHAGGAQLILEEFPEALLISNRLDESVTVKESLRYQACQAGLTWRWSGAEFNVLHPESTLDSSGAVIEGNDASCVLRAQIGQQAILLPGDIGRSVEYELARRYGSELNSSVLIAPHHGSQTSSSYPLLKLSEPDWVVFSAAYQNSFGHPAPQVVARYAEFGSGLLNTANSGMLSFWLDGKGSKPEFGPEFEQYRVESGRYWRRSQNDYWCRYYDQDCEGESTR